MENPQIFYFGYLLAFVAATAACLGAAWRVRTVSSPRVRRPLTWFFLGSAGWAGTYVGFLLASSPFGKHLFYQGSLLIGFATLIAWLWFCSAYSGRTLHREPQVQTFVIAVCVTVTGLKLTNPLHSLYYGLEPTGGPFGLVVSHEALYWVVMAMAYALAATGYLMIFEVFLRAGAHTGPLAMLTGLTALPALLNVVGHLRPAVLDITHEPLGVAVFAMGLLFVYERQFSVVQLTRNVEAPNLTVGSEGQILGLGGGIAELVPPLNEECLGAPLAEVLPGLDRAVRAGEPLWEADFGEETRRRYYQIVTADLEEDGDTQTVVLSDITEQERRDRRLERQNDLFAKAQSLADVGAWEYDVQEDRLIWSREVYRIHGVSDDFDLTPENAIRLYHEDDQSQIAKALARAIEEGDSYDEELRIRRPDGTVRRIRVYGKPQIEDGKTVRVRGAFQDITDQKRREEMLRELREKYQGLLEGAPDAIFVADAESGKITEANQAAASLMGAPTDEIVGRHQSDLHPSEETEKYRSFFMKAMRGAEDQSMSFNRLDDGSQASIETDSGEHVPVEISATLVELGDREEDGEAFVGIFRDITERKRKAERLREAKDQAELAKLEAEEASRMKSAMLANMSHEIRTPLTGIIGFAEAIGEEVEGEGEVSRFADLIEGSGRRLLDTLDAVLNLSKLEAGKMSLKARPVDLAGQAEQVAQELRPEAEKSDLSLAVKAEAAQARADEGGVKIVLQNLLSNAIKYTEDGRVEVRTYQDQEEAVLEVEDTGIGMAPEMAESLFEPFRQASEGLAREYEGTGVGLAVTKKATEEMGGSIDVETEKGEGSRFTVRLPATEGGAAGTGESEDPPVQADRSPRDETVVEGARASGAGDAFSGRSGDGARAFLETWASLGTRVGEETETEREPQLSRPSGQSR